MRILLMLATTVRTSAVATMALAGVAADAQDRYRLGTYGNGSNVQQTQRANHSATGSSVYAPPAIVSTSPATCVAQTVGWRVGPANCSAVAPATPDQGTVAVTDNTSPGTGSATFLCNNGTFYLAADVQQPGCQP